MGLSRTVIAGLISILLSGCSAVENDSAGRSKPAIESVYTDIAAASCRKEADKSDPNETPYLVCPGVAGYSLILRRVDAGRQSIDIVDAARRIHPLNYQEFVTRRMFTLDPKAEWRVAAKAGTQVPIALIVRVRAHEDNENPEKVTHQYLAVAKIAPDEVCVTDSIPEGARSDAEVRSAADSARDRKCAPPQPPMTADGTVIR